MPPTQEQITRLSDSLIALGQESGFDLDDFLAALGIAVTACLAQYEPDKRSAATLVWISALVSHITEIERQRRTN